MAGYLKKLTFKITLEVDHVNINKIQARDEKSYLPITGYIENFLHTAPTNKHTQHTCTHHITHTQTHTRAPTHSNI